MRAAIALIGMLMVSSVLAAGAAYDANGLPQMDVAAKAPVKQQAKAVSRVTKETPMSEGSLEKFGVTGSAQ